MADKQLEQLYISAYNRIKNAKTAADYQDAITLLKKCNGFADSESLLHQCEENIYQLSLEESYQNAINLSLKKDSVFLKKAATLFEELGDFKDSKERLNAVRRKIEKINEDRVTLAEISCPKCGHINHGGEHCSKCGAPLNTTGGGKGKNKKTIFIVLGVALFLALIVCALVLLNRPSDKEEDRPSDDSDSSYTDTVDNIPEDAIDNMDNIAFGRAYTLYEESLGVVDDMNESDLCWRALHLCFMQEYLDLNEEGTPPELYDGYYAVPEERVHEAMYACFGNDDAWGDSSSEYEESETEHIAFVIGNADVSLERLETTVSEDKNTATVEYILKEYEDYDGDGNQEVARFTIDYVPNEHVQIDSEKPLYYKIDDIDFETTEENNEPIIPEPDSTPNLAAPESARIDIDKEVSRIGEMYDEIDQHDIGGSFTNSKQTGNVIYKYIDTELVEINVAPSSSDEYEKVFYFDDGKLFFAYYFKDKGDAYHFYFKNGILIRIRYREDYKNYDQYTNYNYYDYVDSDEYDGWQRRVLSAANMYYNDQ